MNPYSVAISSLGLSRTSQGDLGQIYLLLASLAVADDTPATAGNPFAEVLARLSPYEGHGLQKLREVFSSQSIAFERGVR